MSIAALANGATCGHGRVMIDAVIFDKDGTLYDFRRSWGAWAQAFLSGIAASRDEARALGQAIGYDLDTESFSPDSVVIAGTAAEIADILLPRMRDETLTSLTDRINREAGAARMQEVLPLADYLGGLRSRGLRIGLATNDSEAPARAHLDASGVTPLFDFIAGADSGHGAKPEPGMLLAFASSIGVPANRIVMVGDSLHDLMAGRAAGMRTAAVLTGMAGKDVLDPFADVVLPDIAALPGWIEELGQTAS